MRALPQRLATTSVPWAVSHSGASASSPQTSPQPGANLAAAPTGVPLAVSHSGASARTTEATLTPPCTAPASNSAAPNQWAPEDESKVKAYIDDALAKNHDDVALSFAYLRDQRQQQANWYDTNMAIAADYLRARWDTQRSGPFAARQEVDAYITLKEMNAVPKEGPGPISPYSDLQAKYMRQGIDDQSPLWQQALWTAGSVISPVVQGYGYLQVLWGTISHKS